MNTQLLNYSLYSTTISQNLSGLCNLIVSRASCAQEVNEENNYHDKYNPYPHYILDKLCLEFALDH